MSNRKDGVLVYNIGKSMRTKIRLTFFAFLSMFAFEAYGTTIYISNPYQRNLSLETLENVDLPKLVHASAAIYDTLQIDSKRRFRIIATFKDSNQRTLQVSYVLNPEEIIYLDYDDDGCILHVRENGSRNSELQFFQALNDSLGIYEGYLAGSPFSWKDPETRLKRIRELYAQRLAFLSSQNGISKEFKEYVAASFYAKQYIDFFQMYVYDPSEVLDIHGVAPFLEAFLEPDIEVDKDDFYQLQSIFLRMKHFKKSQYLNYCDFLLDNSDEAIYTYCMYQLMPETISSKKASPVIAHFLKNSSNTNFKASVMKKYVDYIPTNQTVSQEILFTEWEEILRLPGTKYVDFWASWCAPCRAEMPASLELKKQFPKIQFIYVSTDKTPQAWMKASEKEGLPKENSFLLSSKSHAKLYEKFNLNTIPRYMLVSEDGKVLIEDAPRPSSKEINEVLQNIPKIN